MFTVLFKFSLFPMFSPSRWCQSALLLLIYLCHVRGSVGDLSPYYQMCVNRCISSNCSSGGHYKEDSNPERSRLNELLGWTCDDECQYSCMWPTVSAFQGRGWPVPQFYGKWPFARILGLQEAASVVFSALNFLAQFMVMRKFSIECCPHYPHFWLWTTYSVVSMNSWIWSMVFHARDTPFTEIMDYLSAFLVVTYFLFCLGARVWFRSRRGAIFVHALFCTCLYLHHSTYLLLVKFDYGYNMFVNVTVGTLTSLAWLCWCWNNRYTLPHVRYLVQFLLSTAASMALEVLDFPPLFWLLDAHALWHMSTIPLPFLLFRFVREDCKYLKVIDHKHV